MLISQQWHDNPAYYSYDFLFSTHYTQSRFKRVIRSGKQLGLILDMKLKKDCHHLAHEDIQTIFTHTEKALIHLVPNKLELNILPDPDNTIWLLRPEARYNGVSQL